MFAVIRPQLVFRRDSTCQNGRRQKLDEHRGGRRHWLLTEIERIKMANPGFVLVYDFALDGHEALRFQNSDALLYQYIIDHFERLPDSRKSVYQIYKAKGDNQ